MSDLKQIDPAVEAIWPGISDRVRRYRETHGGPPEEPTTAARRCDFCSDVGWVIYEGETEHTECPKCDIVAIRRRDRLMRQLAPLAPIKPPYDRYTFDDFPAKTEAQARAKRTLQTLGEADPVHVLLIGNIGSGKTSLGTCLYRAWVDAGTPGMWWQFPQMLDHIRAGFDRETRTYRATDMMAVIYQAPLLFLDDIGAEKTTEWAAAELYKVLVERELRPTIITSNFGLDRLCERFMIDREDPQGERIASRLEGMCGDRIYRFEGNSFPDLRQSKNRGAA